MAFPMASMNPMQIVTYINVMETTVCGEWHAAEWPDCDHPNHSEGRVLLEALGAEPQRGGTEYGDMDEEAKVMIDRTPHTGQDAVWDWFGDKDTYGVRRGDEVVCYTSRTKKGYERAKKIAELLNQGDE